MKYFIIKIYGEFGKKSRNPFFKKGVLTIEKNSIKGTFSCNIRKDLITGDYKDNILRLWFTNRGDDGNEDTITLTTIIKENQNYNDEVEYDALVLEKDSIGQLKFVIANEISSNEYTEIREGKIWI